MYNVLIFNILHIHKNILHCHGYNNPCSGYFTKKAQICTQQEQKTQSDNKK
jgi:hypothetical protein